MSRGRPPRKRSPQEKKLLSLLKDRRNLYGENDKASRKAIPLRKAMAWREERRAARSALGQAIAAPEEAADVIESDLRKDIERARRWKKAPDAPLGEAIARQARSRAQRAGRAARRSPGQVVIWGD